jgi:formylmethanofuran dehydrogenase subunit C
MNGGNYARALEIGKDASESEFTNCCIKGGIVIIEGNGNGFRGCDFDGVTNVSGCENMFTDCSLKKLQNTGDCENPNQN